MVRIDISQIPEIDIENLCADFLDAIKEFYDDPKNLREALEKMKKADNQ